MPSYPVPQSTGPSRPNPVSDLIEEIVNARPSPDAAVHSLALLHVREVRTRVLVSEQARIAFLLQRDRPAAAVRWVGHILGIYRSAVLDKRHSVRTVAYRRSFVESYCEFKRWLTVMLVSGDRDGTA